MMTCYVATANHGHTKNLVVLSHGCCQLKKTITGCYLAAFFSWDKLQVRWWAHRLRTWRTFEICGAACVCEQRWSTWPFPHALYAWRRNARPRLQLPSNATEQDSRTWREKKVFYPGECFLFPDLPVVFCLTAEKCCELLHGQGHFYQLLSPEAVPAVQQRKPMKWFWNGWRARMKVQCNT